MSSTNREFLHIGHYDPTILVIIYLVTSGQALPLDSGSVIAILLSVRVPPLLSSFSTEIKLVSKIKNTKFLNFIISVVHSNYSKFLRISCAIAFTSSLL